MAKTTKLSSTQIQELCKNYTNLCAEVHGYDYAAGTLESLLSTALSELKSADQAFLLRVVAGMTQTLTERKAAGVTACQ